MRDAERKRAALDICYQNLTRLVGAHAWSEIRKYLFRWRVRGRNLQDIRLSNDTSMSIDIVVYRYISSLFSYSIDGTAGDNMTARAYSTSSVTKIWAKDW